MQRDRIVQLAQRFEGQHLDLLRDLVNQNSHADNPDGLRACIELLRPSLTAMGFVCETREIQNGGARTCPHLLAARPGDGPRQLVLCHLDTVFPEGSPFRRLDRQADRWIGPGVADMKGGIVTALLNLRILHESGALSRAGWMICFTGDEEQGSPTGKQVLAEVAQGCDTALCFEAARPGGGLVVGRKGIGVTRAVVRGRSGHAGIGHDEGINAFTQLCRLVVAIEALEQDFADLSVSAGGPVRVTPEQLNRIPDYATGQLEWRFGDPETAAPLTAAIAAQGERLARETGATIELSSGVEAMPMTPTPRSRALYRAYQAAAQDLGLTIAPVVTAGVGDCNQVARFCPACLDGVGPEGGAFHSPDEYILVRTVAERAALNALAFGIYHS